MQNQQGDVTMEKVDSLPDGCKRINPGSRGYVLAEGEATGHAHCIAETDPAICELYELDGTLYVKATRPVELHHEEHHTHTIEIGITRIGKLKEFDYFSKMVRELVD